MTDEAKHYRIIYHILLLIYIFLEKELATKTNMPDHINSAGNIKIYKFKNFMRFKTPFYSTKKKTQQMNSKIDLQIVKAINFRLHKILQSNILQLRSKHTLQAE